MKYSPLFIKIAGALFFILSVESLGAQADGEGKASEDRKIEVNMSEVSARVSPSVEFVAPVGNVYESYVHYFNNLEMSFNMNYNFLQNSIIGDVAFSYPYRRITPEARFFLNLDNENYFYPDLEKGQIRILPAEKYILRQRGFETSMPYTIFKDFQLVPSFILTDTFKGNLTEERVLDEGTDLTLRTGAVYHTLTARKPEHMLTFEGVYVSSYLDWLFRNSFNDPTSLSNVNRLVLNFGLNENWQFNETVSLNYPIKSWNKEISGFYSLGGFDTIRGYKHGSINAFRFFLLMTQLEKQIFKDKEFELELGKINTHVHQFQLLFLIDQLLTQDTLEMSGRLNSFTSVGTGLSFVFTGESGGHLKTELCIAQPLEKDKLPLLYLKASFFNFPKQL